MSENKAKKAATVKKKAPLKDKVKKTAAAVVVAATVSSCTLTKKELTAAMAKKYDYDTFEARYAIYNGLFDAIKPSGDMFKDISRFLFGQGGGMSNDPKDLASKYPCPVPFEKDGKKITGVHTNKDITYRLFVDLAPILKYEATPELFYEMPEDLRNSIIQYHIDLAKDCSKSDVVNYVAAYSVWGSGTYKWAKRKFEQLYGNIDVNIANRGEYFTFSRLLECYRTVLQERNAGVNWNTYGRGWSSGIAHFHRVFKVYCKS